MQHSHSHSSALGSKQAPQPSASNAPANPFLLKVEDFKTKQADRPDFDCSLPIEISKSPNPLWKYGDGLNDRSRQALRHVEIDPNQPGRTYTRKRRAIVPIAKAVRPWVVGVSGKLIKYRVAIPSAEAGHGVTYFERETKRQFKDSSMIGWYKSVAQQLPIRV